MRTLNNARSGWTGCAMSTVIFAVPMLGLYSMSIVIAFIFQKKRKPALD